ncbi:MAG: hypothetical protein LBP75_00825 [Planctomycetota bacterium]|jgi:hypothetical protein|nr:hypothetical protein [Planctomycetota bacterium]
MKNILLALWFALLPFAPANAANAADDDYPKSLSLPAGELSIYRPQPEELSGTTLKSRAAVAFTPSGKTDKEFGAAWFAAELDSDRDERLATVRKIAMTKLKFADATALDAEAIKISFNALAAPSSFKISLEDLTAALRAAADDENIRHDPPKIFVRRAPAMLVVVDGDPQYSPVENSAVLQLVNSPFGIFLLDKKYYLAGGTSWFAAPALAGKWRALAAEKVPAAIISAAADDVVMPSIAAAPEIIVSTEPAELIEIDGATRMSPQNGNLMKVTNSENTLFYDAGSGKYFVLLSGRWFANKELSEKNWAYVEADALPADFQKIPASDENFAARAAVAGTDEAVEAAMDAQIPHTTKILLKDAPVVTVEYDGDPQFATVENSAVRYVVNASQPVFYYQNLYYACVNGVWYAGATPHLWTVCAVVPDALYQLPPSHPYYYTRYVYVYERSPEYVIVGYTPGYTGSFYYRGVIVYGTGYYYRPWYRHRYFPRPYTFGFRAAYHSSSADWFFAIGRRSSSGFFAVNFRRDAYAGNWWGPQRYRDSNLNFFADANRRNVYDDARRDRPAPRPVLRPRPAPVVARHNEPRSAAPVVRDNVRESIMTDRSGNVYRRGENNQWQQRQNNGWVNRAPQYSEQSVVSSETRQAPPAKNSGQSAVSSGQSTRQIEPARNSGQSAVSSGQSVTRQAEPNRQRESAQPRKEESVKPRQPEPARQPATPKPTPITRQAEPVRNSGQSAVSSETRQAPPARQPATPKPTPITRQAEPVKRQAIPATRQAEPAAPERQQKVARSRAESVEDEAAAQDRSNKRAENFKRDRGGKN